MKTSNKILFVIISIIGLSILSVLIFAKSSLINVENNTVNGDGNITIKTHNIGEISFFKASGNYEIFVKKGKPQLIIETDENIQSFINPSDDNYVSNGKDDSTLKKMLRIGKINNIELKPTESIKIYLTTPTLESVNIGGITKLTFEDIFTNENFKATIHDFAEVDIKVATENLDIKTDGSCKLNINGTAGDTKIEAGGFSVVSVSAINAQTVDIESNGNAEIKTVGISQKSNFNSSGFSRIIATDLSVKEATITAKENAEILLAVSDQLNVEAAGFAAVNYSGSPAITKNISGQASLKAIE
jgi:putative autotransporter adhesin-like protein